MRDRRRTLVPAVRTRRRLLAPTARVQHTLVVQVERVRYRQQKNVAHSELHQCPPSPDVHIQGLQPA